MIAPRRKLSRVVVLLAFCLMVQGAMMAQSPVKAVYGVRSDLPIFAGKSPAELADSLQSWGVNAVFGGYEDSNLVGELHRRGIRVFAEIGLFVGADLWERFPWARPIKADGKPLEKIEWYAGVNPAVPEVQEYRLRQLEHLLRAYPVDGVWLDFIRWPAKWERPDPILPETSFDPFTTDLFSKTTGIQIPGNLVDIPSRAAWVLQNHRREWTAFRCDVIRDFVARARAVCDSVREGVLLGAFIVPWTDRDFDGALTRVVGQDLPTLGPLLDVISPMVYHRLCGREVAWIEDVSGWQHRASGRPVWPIVQSVDEPEPIAPGEFEEALRAALRAEGSEGVIVFTLGKTSAEKIRVLRKVFSGL